MTYNSLLTRLDNQRTQPWIDYQFEMGGLTDIESVAQVLRESKNIETKVFYPHKIVRGLINSKTEDGFYLDFRKGEKYLELITDAMNFCKRVYSEEDYGQALEDLIDKIKKYDVEINPRDCPLTKRKMLEIDDHVSWTATHPDLNDLTANLLSQFSNILMIPMAHGSLRAATDIFLRYQDMKPENDSVIYPVRFSAHKCQDKRPQFSRAENDYLKRNADGKEIIIFDEDIKDGNTLVTAVGVFEELFGREVTAVANTSRHTNAGIISRDDLKFLNYRGKLGVKI